MDWQDLARLEEMTQVTVLGRKVMVQLNRSYSIRLARRGWLR